MKLWSEASGKVLHGLGIRGSILKSISLNQFPSARTYASTVNTIKDNKYAVLQITDCQTYLNHCRNKEVNITSTVFRGTLYEFSTKILLEDYLNCYNLVRKGGAFDNGVDLFGKWDLGHFFEAVEPKLLQMKTLETSMPIQSLVSNSKEFLTKTNDIIPSPMSISLKNDIKIIVQCKNHGTKIKGSIIREIIGIYSHHIENPNDINTTFMILVSPAPLTKQAQSIIDQSNLPILHIILSPLTLSKNKEHYNLNSWSGGSIGSIYMNHYASMLLSHLNMQLEFEKLKNIVLL